MCYHCATNPSIHHRCRHVATVSLPLSHHGVTFTVTSSQFRRCHCNVAFIVALLQCCCHSRVVAVPLLSHCRGFVIAVVVSPSHLSQFCCRCCGVTFVSVVVLLLPSRCCLRCCIVMVSSLSRCCLHCCIVAVSSSQFRRRHCGVAFIIALLQCCHCSFVVTVAVSLSLLHRRHLVVSSLQSHCCSHIVASLWLWLWLWSWSHHGHGHHGCGCGHVVVFTIVAVSLWSLLLRCGRCCCVVVVVVVVVVASWLWLLLHHGHHHGCCIVVVLLWSLWSWSWSRCSHHCVVSTKSRLSRRPSAFWPGVESQNTTIRHVIGVIEHDVPPLVIFVVASSHRRHVIIVAVIVSSLS